MSKIRIATIFSGIGSPEEAVKQVFKKHKTIFACELDKFARLTYLANHKIKPKRFYTDINLVKFKKYRHKIDIIIGGSPCQSFSGIGKREGLKSPQGQLITEYARCVEEVLPKVFIFENVGRFSTMNKGRDFEAFCTYFRGLGYTISHFLLKTNDYDIAQSRKRLFIVGSLNGKTLKISSPRKLTTCIRDYLEDNVSDKYYLSDRLIKSFKEYTTRNKLKGNGFRFKITPKDGICGTITTKFGNRQGDTYIRDGKHNKVRRLTPRECFRLQAFPDSFDITRCSNTQLYKQIGNAMSVNVVIEILKAIKNNKLLSSV